MKEKGLIPRGFSPALAAAGKPNILINRGDGLQIQENYGPININVGEPELEKFLSSMFGIAPARGPVTHALEWSFLCKTHYCLFVLENEEYNDGVFSIAKERALQKYTPRSVRERYKTLSPETVEELRRMPCIFAKRNMYYKTTDARHPFLAGRIRDIIPQGENIKIYFSWFQAFSQQLLNQNIKSLRMASAALRNELDEEHWAIKECNLLSIFESLNLVIK